MKKIEIEELKWRQGYSAGRSMRMNCHPAVLPSAMAEKIRRRQPLTDYQDGFWSGWQDGKAELELLGSGMEWGWMAPSEPASEQMGMF